MEFAHRAPDDSELILAYATTRFNQSLPDAEEQTVSPDPVYLAQ
jgi:hypothetical protein